MSLEGGDMDRPGYVTRCPICYDEIIVIDTYQGSSRHPKTKAWITRWFDPDWVISRHIETTHK